MEKSEKKVRKSVVLLVGKMLTLCGVALTFAACYGVAPDYAPDYWGAPKDEMLYGEDEQTPQEKADIPETEAETADAAQQLQ